MKSYNIKELAEIISAEIVGTLNGEAEEIYFDSRSIYHPKKGIFFSFGSNQKHINDAYFKGIQAFVTSTIDRPYFNANYLIVDSPLQALQTWAKYHRNEYEFPIVGITGSNGKTIVKEWLNQLLWRDFSIVRSPKSYNSQIGVPISVLQMTTENNLGLFEAGISLPDEMDALEEIIRPQIGVLTHIGSAHMENFETRNQLILEKLKLFKNTRKIVFNADEKDASQFIREMYPTENGHYEHFTFGKAEENTIRLISAINLPKGKQIKIMERETEYTFMIPFLDDASTENILTVLTTLKALNLSLDDYLGQTMKLLPIEMRLEINEAVRDSLVINDSFNSDLHSVKVALDVLAQQPFPRKSLILTDILESSLSKDELYKQAADMVNSYKINDLILIGEDLPNYKHLFKAKSRVYETTEDFMKELSVKNVDSEAILLKGARPFHLEKISAFLEKKSHDTVLEVNLSALIHNLNYFKSLIQPQTKVMAMIKANSYGTGSFEISQTLEHQGVDYLGAAYADEGVELRKAGISIPIVIMNPEQSSYSDIIDYKLEPEIYSFRVLDLFLTELREKSIVETYPIHIKIETGMNRLGFRPEQLNELIERLKEEKSVEVHSVFTHLATADVPAEREFVLEQLNRFDEAYDKITSVLAIRPIKHALNSAGTIHFPEHQYDMVRLGIGLYGISHDVNVQSQLQNIATFKTVISQISEIQPGETVSYGRKFKADKVSRIATLPVGYADGIRRSLGNGIGKVNINNQLVPIVGTVCMDMVMADVSDIDCEEGDEVIIFGDNPTVNMLARTMHTIPYEVLTSISPRVKRIYYRE